MHEARTRIEKRGDLEAHSFVRAEIIASYLGEGPQIEIPAKLFQSPRGLLRTIPKGAVGEHVRRHGVLRLQRSWVENMLPDYELLDAVAIGRRVVILRVFAKKTQKTPRREIELARQRAKEVT